MAWGHFLTVTLNFIIIAFVLFLVIRAMSRLIRKEEAKPAPPSKQEAVAHRNPRPAEATLTALAHLISTSPT